MIGRPFLERALDGSRKHAAAAGRRDGSCPRPLARARGRAADRTASAAQLAGLATVEDGDRVETMATQAAVMTPTDARAHTLVRGAYDLHVHIAPDVPPSGGSTTSRSARRFVESGLAGFGLKSHYTSTAERAQVVSGRHQASRSSGTLDAQPGRRRDEPARGGDRSPRGCTDHLDADRRLPGGDRGRTEPKPGDKVPQWARLQHELRELGLGVEPDAGDGG